MSSQEKFKKKEDKYKMDLSTQGDKFKKEIEKWKRDYHCLKREI